MWVEPPLYLLARRMPLPFEPADLAATTIRGDESPSHSASLTRCVDRVQDALFLVEDLIGAGG